MYSIFILDEICHAAIPSCLPPQAAEAKKFAEGKPTDETLDVTIESHADAATRSLAVWNWLANAREKFVKSGHKAEDVEKAIANYEKLYKTVSPEMQRYLGYLLKWFF